MGIFALSGFAGLIYQAIWSHYLGLTLGHAAYAQTLVLAIYMGGMAVGAWWASRFSGGLARPIMAYALIELAIGLLGLGFHSVFQRYIELSQASVLPGMSVGAAHVYQWASAALMILPQCILLGMTFPLMVAGCLRGRDGGDAGALGGLYFSNSFGAAAGALVATFVLLPRIGMPGTVAAAGAINVVVAAVAWAMARGTPASGSVAAVEVPATGLDGQAPRRVLAFVLTAAAITGATSFVYEIVWVRLLNQVLGTTLHSFELMLAAFILGLAAGAYWIHRRGERIVDVLRFAGIAQVLMGICALLSVVVFANSFELSAWMVASLPHTDSGYFWFNVGCALLSLLVMFPAAFFAGMTLPLFTTHLLRSGHGERSVGRVYAANTVGAIAGVMVVVHVLVPAIGLHLSLLLAAVADVLLGLVLLRWFATTSTRRALPIQAIAASIALLVGLHWGRVDPATQVSGAFRTGRILAAGDVNVAYLADGKTSTIGVLKSTDGTEVSIVTNGKSDATVRLAMDSPPMADEQTMVMAGSLPLLRHPAPRSVGIIGWGSGMSTHTILGSPAVERVDTVEIEPAMYEGARLFQPRVSRAYDDPRSKVLFEDARTYFAAERKHYDVVVSEPSNPWVSGVANLFTEEFYGFVRSHLNKGGVLVQWLQSYEINDPLLSRLVSALLSQFPQTEVYLTNTSDLLFLASEKTPVAADMARVSSPALKVEMSRVGLGDQAGFDVRRIGGPRVLRAYTRLFGAEGHSDYFPVVALNAPRSRFTGEVAGFLSNLVDNGMPVLDVLDGRRPMRRVDLAQRQDEQRFIVGQRVGAAVADALVQGPDASKSIAVDPRLTTGIKTLRRLSGSPVAAGDIRAWSDAVAVVAASSIGLLDTNDLQSVWIDPTWLSPGQPAVVDAVMRAYRAAAARDAAGMQEHAVAVLAIPHSGLSDAVREQMLVLAMLGAAAQGDKSGPMLLEQQYGGSMASSDDMGQVRSFVLAWVDE